MAKQKKPSIKVFDIKTFRQMSEILTILDNWYNGEMPLDKYNGFLKVISNPGIKAYFARNFKPHTVNSTPVTAVTSNGKKTESRQCYSSQDNSTTSDTSTASLKTTKKYKYRGRSQESIMKVKATDFSCKHTETGPTLMCRSHQSFYYVKSEWLQPRVLNAIDRTFRLKLSNYLGFIFVPTSDKEVFLSLLEQTYSEVKQQIYNEQLDKCLKSIERYLDHSINTQVLEYHNIKFDITLADCSFDEDKQLYTYKLNALEFLNIKSSSVRVHFPLKSIIEQLNESDRNTFKDEIISKYPDGYVSELTIENLFPNNVSLEIKVSIPKIFVMRYVKDAPIGIKANYSSDLGYFRADISSNLPGYRYRTETSGVVFSDEVKNSLINILRKIDNNYIITFYSAFVRMFNEGDALIQSNYMKHIKALSPEEDDYYRHPKYYLYYSGESPLLPFDIENSNDWMWLTTQMKNGVFLNAYAFRDKNETVSSYVGDTVRNSFKVYLTVEDANNPYKDYQDQIDHTERAIISMYALDTTKSTYRFEVEKDKINEVIFYIWGYFSSNNWNKREDLTYLRSLGRLFGVRSFYKDSPLENRSGIGYCDRKWLTDN